MDIWSHDAHGKSVESACEMVMSKEQEHRIVVGVPSFQVSSHSVLRMRRTQQPHGSI